MPGLELYAYALRGEMCIDGAGHLLGEPFLQLGLACMMAQDFWKPSQPGDSIIGTNGDGRSAKKGKQMMGTKTVKGKVSYHDEFLGRGFQNRGMRWLCTRNKIL